MLYLWLYTIVGLSDLGQDPLQQSWSGRQAARRFDCQRMSQAEAHKLYPARVPATHARAQTFMHIDALVCSRTMVPAGKRAPRDEAILSTLTADVAQATKQAAALGTDETRWYVETLYPRAEMVNKISNAARNSLAERGNRVMGQAPLLAAGDILVFHKMRVRDSLPLACARLFAEESLVPGDGLLAFAIVDPRESRLHAGICLDGNWRWVR